MSIETSPLYIQGAQVSVRLWENRDDSTQRTWPRYKDPFCELWNIPRSPSLYNSLLSSYVGILGGRRVWAIEHFDSKLIGRISLRDIDQRTHQARLGISLRPDYVGQGLGTEAMKLFLDYFFDELHFRTMVLDVAAFNLRAVHCYERLGFAQVGHEWRKSYSGNGRQALTDPAYRHLQPYFQYERGIMWVQFLEMALDGSSWSSQR